MKDNNSLEAAGDVVGIGVSELPEVHLGLGVHLCQEAHLHLEVHSCQEGQEGLLANVFNLRRYLYVAGLSVVVS